MLDSKCCDNTRSDHRDRQSDAETEHEGSPERKTFELQAKQQHRDGGRTGNQSACKTKADDLPGRDVTAGEPALDVVGVRTLVRILKSRLRNGKAVVSMVLAMFMGGMAIGSWLCSRVSGGWGTTEADWAALRGNVAHLGEVAEWLPVIHGYIAAPEVVPDDKPFLAQAAEAAAALDWSNEPWRQLTDALKANSGRKGRALFHPLRLALTGHESGPEMAALLPIIGRDRALARLRQAAS